MRVLLVSILTFGLMACAQTPSRGPALTAEQERYLAERQKIRDAQSVPVVYVATSCFGHGDTGYVYSFSVEEPIYGQFSRRMIWGGSGNCATVLSGYPVPKTWTPGMKVKVRWKPDSRDWIEKTTTILPYDRVGDLYVHFFPNDEVRVVVSRYYPESPNHPIHPDSLVPPPEPE